MDLTLSRQGDIPMYRQIVNQIGEQIRRGALQPGDRLPTVRELAATHGLTRLTVHTAYSELQSQDLIESYVGRGTFVSASARMTPTHVLGRLPISWANRSRLGQLLRQPEGGDTISFARAVPEPATYPLKDIREATRRALQRADVLDYGTIQGDASLRQQMSRLLIERGLTVAPDALVVTTGAQQGIDLAVRAFTVPGDVVLIDAPTYAGILETGAQQGRRLLGINRDGSGFDMQALEAACRAYRPALLYTVPTFGNPTGASLPPDQRAALLDLARKHNFLVLEDDIYGFLPFDGPAPPPLKCADSDDRVIYVTSLSKTLAPSLRIGVLVASRPRLPAVAEAKQGSDLVSSLLLQRTVAEYLQTGRFGAHLERARAVYRERRDTMLRSLDRHLPTGTWTRPAGGLSLWLTLPDGVDERDFVRDAADEGVIVAPGRLLMAHESHQAHIRLSYGGQSPVSIEKGVATLGRVLQRHLGHGELIGAGRSVGPLV